VRGWNENSPFSYICGYRYKSGRIYSSAFHGHTKKEIRSDLREDATYLAKHVAVRQMGKTKKCRLETEQWTEDRSAEIMPEAVTPWVPLGLPRNCLRLGRPRLQHHLFASSTGTAWRARASRPRSWTRAGS